VTPPQATPTAPTQQSTQQTVASPGSALALPLRHPRRDWLLQAAALALGSPANAGAANPGPAHPPPDVTRPGARGVTRRPLVFPADFGAHPDTALEWWYVTGWLAEAPEAAGRAAASTSAPVPADSAAPQPGWGFQVTFFRSRTAVAASHLSRFAARQLVLAHVAITDLGAGRLQHDQRIARAFAGLAGSAEGDTRVQLRDWRLARQGPAAASVYRIEVPAAPADLGLNLGLDLQLQATQPLLLQGDGGYSRKGPHPEQASHYYSQPQLAVQGTLRNGSRQRTVQGRAWFDHEWSNALLAADAVGWDWIGINLFDGSALTAFRLRRADGSVLWAGGSWRAAGGRVRSFGADEVVFTPLQRWTSPATGANYPTRWQVDSPAGRWQVRALLDAQELDSRRSTGTVYWEGLSELLDERGQRAGLGYLEMTGYVGRLAL